jgi:hypothetical protein
MRAALVIGGLWASTALAQNGVWGGYVTGWQSSPTYVNRYVGNTQVIPAVRPTFVAPAYGYYGWPAYSSFQSDEYVEQQREQARVAQQQAIAMQQEQAERECECARAAEAQMVAQQQAIALQQQMLAQQQQQALMEAQARLAEREALAKQQAELEQKALAEKEAARAREEDAKPREKGPDIHRWVDDDGVVHLSTKPRR